MGSEITVFFKKPFKNHILSTPGWLKIYIYIYIYVYTFLFVVVAKNVGHGAWPTQAGGESTVGPYINIYVCIQYIYIYICIYVYTRQHMCLHLRPNGPTPSGETLRQEDSNAQADPYGPIPDKKLDPKDTNKRNSLGSPRL